jgi:NAD(P)-dependent dehydrogenase (short-subunit alcohol dehydrogenase family)
MSAYAPAYSISKTALNAFSPVLAATYQSRGVLVNAADPGWVRTDMGGKSAPRSVEQGAEKRGQCLLLGHRKDLHASGAGMRRAALRPLVSPRSLSAIR